MGTAWAGSKPHLVHMSWDRQDVLNVCKEKPSEKPQLGYCRVNAKLPRTGSEERAQAHGACTELLLLAWLVSSGCTSNSPVGLTENCNGKALEDEHNCPISQTVLFTPLSCKSKLLKTAETAWHSSPTLQLPSSLLDLTSVPLPHFGLVLSDRVLCSPG